MIHYHAVVAAMADVPVVVDTWAAVAGVPVVVDTWAAVAADVVVLVAVAKGGLVVALDVAAGGRTFCGGFLELDVLPAEAHVLLVRDVLLCGTFNYAGRGSYADAVTTAKRLLWPWLRQDMVMVVVVGAAAGGDRPGLA
jgi:hypothetical protein